MLEILGLNKSYGSKIVLQNLNTSFHEGNIYGIIGGNGAGKTTLFRCICQLENYSGSIKHEVYTNSLKNNIAYLPTEPYFYPKITGNEFIEFYRKISGRKIDRKLDEIKELFELPLNSYIDKYSTGMKKKIAFLAVLNLQRSIYILDEPFNGLDIHAVLLFKKIILKLKETSTIIVSSHILDSLKNISDTIQYLQDGKFEKEYFANEYDKIEDDIYNSLKIK